MYGIEQEDWSSDVYIPPPPVYQNNEQNRVFSRGGGSRFQGGGKEHNGFKHNGERSGPRRRNGEFGNRNRENGTEGSDIKRPMIVFVGVEKVGRIIGKGGSKIKELESQSGARIKILQPNNDDPWQTRVVLTGSEEAQCLAKEMLEKLIDDRPPPEPVKEPEPYQPIDWKKVMAESLEAERLRWINCPPIKKNFYNEDSEVAGLSPRYVEDFRKGRNGIVVKNVFEEIPIPNPVQNFEQAFRDYPEILQEIDKLGFKEPSPIQCQAWPVLLSGRDLIGIAQTGTGKTLAFLLPALIHIDGQPVPRVERGGPNVLIIAPTRELAQQIEEEVKKYSYRGIKSVCVYGGGNRREQVDIVSAGVEIIIATPGRLNDLIADGVVEVSTVTYLVLDEADRMLDMGFEPQIRKVLLDIRPDRQSVMTSATWPPGVRSLAERYMKNPVQVFVGSLDLAAVHSVTQTILIVNKEEKRDYLVDQLVSLTPEDKIIIFVGRKSMADHLSSDLAFQGYVCQSIHGDRAQEDREQALKDLKSGEVRILIATDVASRGIDITDVTKVVNFDFPRNIEEYVHRVGRTGRAGRSGEAITFFTREDWSFAAELIEILDEAGQLIPEELYGMRDRFIEMKARKEAERSSEGGYGGRRDRDDGGWNGRRTGGGGRWGGRW